MYEPCVVYNATIKLDDNCVILPQDPRGAVVQIADFLGCPLTDEAIDRVVEKSTVDSMKQRFSAADDKSGMGKIGPLPFVVRKGKSTYGTNAQNNLHQI